MKTENNMQTIYSSEFSFIPVHKEVTVYFHGEVVDTISSTSDVTKKAQAHITSIMKAYNHKEFYHNTGACRRIREIQEGRKFPITYVNFEDYVRDWPEAEPYRAWITNSGRNETKFMQIAGHWNALPGGYFWVSVREYNVGKGR